MKYIWIAIIALVLITSACEGIFGNDVQEVQRQQTTASASTTNATYNLRPLDSSSSTCYYCSNSGRCSYCYGTGDCQNTFGLHMCNNGRIRSYTGDYISCSACYGRGYCAKCQGTGVCSRCPH